MFTRFADFDSLLIVLSCTKDANALTYVVTLESKADRCPKCQHVSHKRYSAYMRVIHDLLIHGKRVQLYLKTRKWFYMHVYCETKVFTERFEWLLPYRQRTLRLDTALHVIAFSTHCVEAAHVTRMLGMPVSHDTLLRLVHTTKVSAVHSPFCRH